MQKLKISCQKLKISCQKLKISCQTKEALSLSELENFQPASFKEFSKESKEKLKKSLLKYGFFVPIFVWGNGKKILDGHHRVSVLREISNKYEIPPLPIIRIEAKTEKEASEKLLLINSKYAKITKEGFSDFTKIFELDEIEIAEIVDLPEFSIEEIEPLELEGETDPDSVPDIPKKPKAKRGDIYELGEHRLMCGDSTVLSDVEKLMDGEMADMVFTDPPYNLNYEGSAGKIKNDNMKSAEFRQFLVDSFLSFFTFMKKGGVFYVCHSETEGHNFRNVLLECGFKISSCLIWKKQSLVLGRSDYQWQHEPILYGWKEGHTHFWKGGRTKTTILNSKDVQFDENGNVIIEGKFGKFLIKGRNLEVLDEFGTILEFKKPQQNKKHPTMKPVDLIIKTIKNSSKINQIILDLFGGSGSTLIACEKTNRKCRMIELDEKYCDVIIQRWEKFAGEKAKLISNQIKC